MKVPDSVLVQKVADEAVLLDLDSQGYYGLDAVGTVILEAVSEGKSEAEIVACITAQFDVDADVAQRDLRLFLKELQENKLIK